MILGVDLNSFKVAASLIRPDGSGRLFTFSNKNSDWAVRYAAMQRWMQTIVAEGDRVYIEEPIAGRMASRNIQSTIKIAGAYGAILAGVAIARGSALTVPVSSWKSATVGSGNASKSDIAEWLHTEHPSVHRECSGDQDLMDASCIALYGVIHTSMSARISAGNVFDQAEDAQDPGHRGRRD